MVQLTCIVVNCYGSRGLSVDNVVPDAHNNFLMRVHLICIVPRGSAFELSTTIVQILMVTGYVYVHVQM